MTASAGRTLLLLSLSLLSSTTRETQTSSSMLSTRFLAATARPMARPRTVAVARLAAAPPPLRSAALFATSARRAAVNPNSQQPASDSIKHMGQNAKEEVQGPSSSPPPLERLPLDTSALTQHPGPPPAGIARTVAEAVAGEANDVTSHTAPRKDLGASEVGQEWVRPPSLSPSLSTSCARLTIPPPLPAEHDQGHPKQGPARHARLGRSRPPPLRRHLAQHRLLCAPGLARRRTRRCVTMFTFSLNSRQLEHLSGLRLEADQRLTPSLLARSRCRIRRRGGQRPPRARRAPPDPVRRHHPLVHGRRPLGLRGASRALVPAPTRSLLFLVPSLTSFAASPLSHAVGQVRRHQGQPALPPRRRARHRGLGVAPHPGSDGARHPVGRLLRPVVHGPEGDDQGLGPQVVRDRASLFLSPSRLRFSRSGPSPPPRQFRRAGSALPLRSSRLLGCSHHWLGAPH